MEKDEHGCFLPEACPLEEQSHVLALRLHIVLDGYVLLAHLFAQLLPEAKVACPGHNCLSIREPTWNLFLVRTTAHPPEAGGSACSACAFTQCPERQPVRWRGLSPVPLSLPF